MIEFCLAYIGIQRSLQPIQHYQKKVLNDFFYKLLNVEIKEFYTILDLHLYQ